MNTSIGTVIATITAAVIVLPLVMMIGLIAMIGGEEESGMSNANSVHCTVDSNDNGDSGDKLDLKDAQWEHAATIHAVAQEHELPRRASVIGIATALQESQLTNHGHLGDANDHDSLGLFQQRPSTGWGSPQQITDPEYAADKFFEALAKVKGWKSMPLTQAAQAVQKSAFPEAYAKHESRADKIVAAVDGNTTCNTMQGPAATGESKWVKPVPDGVVSEFRSTDRPDHHGIDLGSSKGTTIVAAAAGTVTTVVCNANTAGGRDYSCDVDGSPQIQGCGWYVDIAHGDKSTTRYCHMAKKPTVKEGQKVRPGQPIGQVGSSGNSSGPHLHFETHTASPADNSNATSPRKFMKSRGVNL